MKWFSALSLLFLMTTHLKAQETFDPQDPIIDEEQLAIEEGSLQSELFPPVSDEVPSPDEIERQEDILYPEGEESSWSLGSEELLSEDFE